MREGAKGDVAADTLTLASTTGPPVAVPEIIFACGHDSGNFNEKTFGLVGLGRGDVSLISQLGTSIDAKFSYCLIPMSETGDQSSKMNFGSNAIVSGNGVVSTPLIQKDTSTSYFLTLEAISVGSKRLKFTGSVLGTDVGNIIIDSGTTFTTVPEAFYSELESAVSSQINATRVDVPESFSLCYDATTDFAIPDITFPFTDADVKLQPLNTFISVSNTISCFAFIFDKFSSALYGNMAHMNFLVGYDIDKQSISFKPTDFSPELACQLLVGINI
ncbi:hypothetical protein REPUB_Repub10bG0013400 [Reevesia pubescens]